MDFLLVAALLPAIVLMVYVYRKDSVEQEPIGLIGRLLLLGAVAGPLAAITENLFFALFESVLPAGTLLIFCEYFIGVALVEEGFKYLFLNTTWKNPAFNYVFDGIVYAVTVALGFAALENVLYVFDGGIEVAIARAIFAVPGHAADGVVMGCFYGLARKFAAEGFNGKARTYRLLALVLPVLEHGIYDFSLSMESEMLAMFGLGIELVFIAIGMVLVNRMSKHDQAIGAQSMADSPAAPLYPAPVERPQQYTVNMPQQSDPTFDQGGWSYPDYGQNVDRNQQRLF